MCLAIKTFHDGDRLVISIDGLPRQSSDEIAMTFLKSLVADTTKAEDATASPVLAEQEEVPNTHVFTDPPFKGLTPEQVMKDCKSMKEQDRVCIQFAGLLDSVDDGLRRSMLAVGRTYLKNRFKDCDADSYGNKLNDAQLLAFYTRYVPYIRKDTVRMLLKRYHRANWNDFLFQDAEVLRKAVSAIVAAFSE